MLKRSIGFFIIFSPFTSYFAISSWLRLPNLLIILCYSLFLLKVLTWKKVQLDAIKVTIEDIVLVSLLAVITLSFLFNGLGAKGLNHVVAYTFVFFMYFIFFRGLVIHQHFGYQEILRMFAISSTLCGSIIILDWILVNFLDIPMREYFVTVDYKIANMLYYENRFFKSVGGVAEEPGSMGLLINIIFPLGLLSHKINNRQRAFFTLLVIYFFVLFCLFSVATFLNAFIASFFIFFSNGFRGTRGWRVTKSIAIFLTILLLSITCLTIYLSYQNYDLIWAQLNEAIDKVALSEENVSAATRTDVWKTAINSWKDNPFFGGGPGNGTLLTGVGYHSVYLTLLADTGIFSLLLFLTFILLHIKKLMKLPSDVYNYLMFALLTCSMHFLILGDFYHAPFWILLVVIHLIVKEYIKKSHNLHQLSVTKPQEQ